MDWILWAGTVGLDTPIPVRAAAAQAAGCSQISIGFDDVRVAAEAGMTAKDLGAALRDRGIVPSVLDGITRWLPSTTQSRPTRQHLTVDEAMVIADDLGVRSVNVIAIGRGPWTLATIAEHFGALCDRAAEFGALLHVEFAPESGVPDLASAWEVVERANRPNGGFLFDTWHFHRSGSSTELLRTLPGDRIMAVQISDAGAEVVGSLWEDTLHHRLLPGDGAAGVEAQVQVLDAIGALQLVGPEVFSDELLALPADDAATLACERTRQIVARARGGHDH